MQGKYNIEQSPFYKLNSRTQLAKLLTTDLLEIEKIIADNNNYHIFHKVIKNKSRIIEVPTDKLAKIHTRIREFLIRIKAPEYLYSSLKGRGCKKNAEYHKGNCPGFKIDIKSFYPSISFSYVWKFFHVHMKCSRHIAWLLTKLTTCDGHIPTGSSVSDILAFYAAKPMFDVIYNLAKELNLNMSLYVDDIVISGNLANGEVKYKVMQLIYNFGLKYHKIKQYKPNDPKYITGIIVKNDELKLSNKQHQKLRQTRTLIKVETSIAAKKKLIESHRGMVRQAQTIEKEIGKKYFSLKVV